MSHTWAASTVVLVYALFCLTVWRRHRRAQHHFPDRQKPAGKTDATVIVFASQTGYAEQLAWQSAETLIGANLDVSVVSLGTLDLSQLRAAQRMLFVVSTTGDGDAPDSAAAFVRGVLRQQTDLSHLRYAVLALGDRSYPQFCAFGHALEQWLKEQGAQALFERIEVDNYDTHALQHWQQQLAVLGGRVEAAGWGAPRYAQWRLMEQHHLNPGSPGAPAFHLRLQLPVNAPDWEAGDIAQIAVRNDPAVCRAVADSLGLDGDSIVTDKGQPVSLQQALETRCLREIQDQIQNKRSDLNGITPQDFLERLPMLAPRDYSIASLPSDGRLELLVRQVRNADGKHAVGSGWLTALNAPGAAIDLSIRRNRSFHPPEDDRPLILIGNGTGIAGLRAHLKLRARRGHHRNWLLFGERSEAHDGLYREELERWQAEGVLQRVDLAYSRHTEDPAYVQDKLRQAATTLHHWVAEGAAIYICGSLTGMASGVADVMDEVLGAETVQRLTEVGRYRRDVY
ncbi:sulfite reductase flavoprotein subunit alpha [Herbaspirillum sp. RTI4]|uniref:sulfite reductase flavoprotein subunit alpha n=1 Tax=Herbaspirillum sp. RTI4 TaxID=3048640 RepID=UPI002AB3FCAA|nr:sulfite reductase flavoprotein subunit alpha [Herbaspirillum sp. RTI4]MDY7576864.1 sulfite reductase flavoprotein subunit alpha [Herbaspirillum sp. RTI4]MEA9982529.1 sulfite reductase flavoprotein subunit alpha [Herbaspirillum sp. RTI4]